MKKSELIDGERYFIGFGDKDNILATYSEPDYTFRYRDNNGVNMVVALESVLIVSNSIYTTMYPQSKYWEDLDNEQE